MTRLLNDIPSLLNDIQSHFGIEKLQFFAPYVWLFRPDNQNIVIKLEETKHHHLLCVNASFARDGSGPLVASFMSMLLIEDSHATAGQSFGICSGEASVTLYHWLNVHDWTVKQFANYLINFEKLALCMLSQASDIRPPSLSNKTNISGPNLR